jgi:ParB family transcriptional regulator, chromosome partitioning protein
MDITLIPLDDIDPAALVRDRARLDPGELLELQSSIAAHGLRMPIEVFPIEGATPWGLISGYRRLAAFRALGALNDRYAAIPAFVRQPGTLTDAIVAMVEENAIRPEISPWEQAMVAVSAWRREVFPSLDAAIATLYASFSRQRQHRLRAVALVAEELDGLLAAPETLSLRQLLRIAAALTRNYGDLMRHALEETSTREPDAQWRLLQSILVESETTEPVAPTPATGPAPRPRRIWSAPLLSLRLRRELTPDGWCLHITGRDAHGELMDVVFDHIENLLRPDGTVTRSIPKRGSLP